MKIKVGRKELFVDWNKLKAEYIAGGTSYRKLAEKYDVSFAILRREAERGNWTKLKAQTKQKADTKIVNAVSQKIADKSVKINNVADKLLDKISETIDELEGLDSLSIKQLASALKDIKDIKGVKSEIDLREQEARIEKLRKDVEGDKPSEDKPCGVILMPPIMEELTPPGEEEDNG